MYFTIDPSVITNYHWLSLIFLLSVNYKTINVFVLGVQWFNICLFFTVYHALYLDHLTLIDFTCKMAMLFSIAESHILEITVQGPSNIQVLVTDEVCIS